MQTLPHAEFVALLASADVSQASFARLSGVSPRQVNNWCRGRAALPRWAGLLGIALRELSAETLTIMLEELLITGPDPTEPRQVETKAVSSS